MESGHTAGPGRGTGQGQAPRFGSQARDGLGSSLRGPEGMWLELDSHQEKPESEKLEDHDQGRAWQQWAVYMTSLKVFTDSSALTLTLTITLTLKNSLSLTLT